MKLLTEQALKQGIAAHKDGRLQDAKRIYRDILKMQPGHPDANHNLGIIATSLNQSDVALPLFKAALQANPKMEQYWLSYIRALVSENQLDDAMRVVQQGKRRGIDTESFNYLTAQILADTPETGHESLNPPQEQLSYLIEQYENGEYVDAEELARSITKKFPNHPVPWNILGAALRKTGNVKKALFPCQKCVQLMPKDASVHYNLGMTLAELDNLEEAERCYKKAIELQPDLAKAYNSLGMTLHELGKIEESNNYLEKAVLIKPDYAEALNNRSVTLRELGKLKEAKDAAEQALTLQPDFAEAHNNLGNTLKEQGKAKEAITSYSHAISIKPDYVDAIINRWRLLYDVEQYDAALKDVDSCNTEKSRAGSLETLYALGRIDEIYKRIEKHAEVDERNLRIAAFSSFISNREKRNTAHNFCNNPLSFLHVSNISTHLKNVNKAVTEIINDLNNVEVIWEPYGKATNGGFQTLKQINLFEIPTKSLISLKTIILEEIDAYYSKFETQPCTLIEKWPSQKKLRAWYVRLKKSGYQEHHIHPDGWISGVVYLQVVPPRGNNEGAIEFSLNGPVYSDVNSPSYLHQPNVGDIILFPSSLHHRTIPFTTDTDRVIISFDLKPALYA